MAAVRLPTVAVAARVAAAVRGGALLRGRGISWRGRTAALIRGEEGKRALGASGGGWMSRHRRQLRPIPYTPTRTQRTAVTASSSSTVTVTVDAKHHHHHYHELHVRVYIEHTDAYQVGIFIKNVFLLFVFW
jgi:hypothetical protein